MPELLEENLSASLLVALRDDSKKHAHQILESLEELEGQVHAMKRALKRSGGGTEGVAGTVSLDVLLERVVGVAGRLEAVQVLHLYAANIGAKMREILIVRLLTKLFGKKTERLEAVQVHLNAVNIAAKMSE